MNKRIVLGLIGVRAVGKTTVIEELVCSHLNIQIISCLFVCIKSKTKGLSFDIEKAGDKV